MRQALQTPDAGKDRRMGKRTDRIDNKRTDRRTHIDNHTRACEGGCTFTLRQALSSRGALKIDGRTNERTEKTVNGQTDKLTYIQAHTRVRRRTHIHVETGAASKHAARVKIDGWTNERTE